MHIVRLLQTPVFSRTHQDEIFILAVDFLYFSYGFKGYIVHAVLFFPKYSLSFYCYFHVLIILSNLNPRLHIFLCNETKR